MNQVRGILTTELQSVRLIFAQKVNKILLAGHAESFEALRKSSSSYKLKSDEDEITYFRSVTNERLSAM